MKKYFSFHLVELRSTMMKTFIAAIWTFFPAFSSYAATVDTVTVFSKVMQRSLNAAVVMPQGYKKSKTLYPVLYLLHGGGGSFRNWLMSVPDKSLLHRMADRHQVVIVTPDGDPTSYYFDSPLDKNSQFETFITRELVEAIEKKYRVIPEKRGRAIAGLSMGGHGAIFLATKYPDLYSAAGSMSGVMNINTATWKVPDDFRKARAQNFERLLGPPKDSIHPYPGYTAVTLAGQMKNNDVKLIFDCGVDDFLIDTNRDLHQKLLANNTPHDYIERPGAHNWEYWQNALPYQLVFFTTVWKARGLKLP